MRFRFLADPEHVPELRSTYLPQMSYTVRPEDTVLAEFAKRWIEIGKAEEIKTESGESQPAEVTAVGKVT
jgi:hypothetical protein